MPATPAIPASRQRTVPVPGEVYKGQYAGKHPLILAVRRDRQGPLVLHTGDHAPIQVDALGNVRILTARSSLSTLSSVASSTTAVTLLDEEINRLGATIFNDSTAVLYLALGGGVSTTNYTVQLSASGYFEIPFGWAGVITGVWAAVNGNARITEFTGATQTELVG